MLMICVYNKITKEFNEYGIEDYLRTIIDENYLAKEMDNLGDILVPYIGLLKPSRIAREMGFMEDCVEEEIEVKASVLEEEIYNEGGTFFLDDVISFSEDGLKEFLTKNKIDYE